MYRETGETGEERKTRSDGEHRNPKHAGLYLSRKPICTFPISMELLNRSPSERRFYVENRNPTRFRTDHLAAIVKKIFFVKIFFYMIIKLRSEQDAR